MGHADDCCHIAFTLPLLENALIDTQHSIDKQHEAHAGFVLWQRIALSPQINEPCCYTGHHAIRLSPPPCSAKHPASNLPTLQAASKTNDTAGDGTTTATILSAAIIAEGMKIVAAGTNPVQLCRGIETTVAALVKELQGISTDVTDADLANVATVSAGGNETV